MIVNCLSCGKSISTKIPHCVYCKSEVLSVEMVQPAKQPTIMPWKERLKGGILSFVIR